MSIEVNGQSVPDDAYVCVFPRDFIPGCLAHFVRARSIPHLAELETNRRARRYVVRAVISDHIPLAGSMEDILSRPSFNLIQVNGNPLTIYLHHGGQHAHFFDIRPGPSGQLSHIEVEVETELPSDTLAPARTAVNELLDTLMRRAWLPLVISRLELYERGNPEPVLHELLLPFPSGIQWGPLGGVHQFPVMAAYESLAREAITTTSPFYRFLCAYRLYEGVNGLRRWLKEKAAQFGVSKALPAEPVVEADVLHRLGFTDAFIQGIRTLNDLRGKFKDHRDRAAHFLLKDDPEPMHTSDGMWFGEYALAGAVLLHYAFRAVRELQIYFNQELGDHFSRGSILPQIENRDRFLIRPEEYWPPGTPTQPGVLPQEPAGESQSRAAEAQQQSDEADRK